MALGIVPARGPWEYRRSAVTSVSNGAFQKGEPVKLDHGRLVSLWSSVDSGFYGIAMGSSANSLPAGQQIIAIPSPGCTAYMDVATTEVASGLSLGQTGSFVSANGITSQWSGVQSKSFSSAMITIVGPVDVGTISGVSRIEICFLVGTSTFYSASSMTLNN